MLPHGLWHFFQPFCHPFLLPGFNFRWGPFSKEITHCIYYTVFQSLIINYKILIFGIALFFFVPEVMHRFKKLFWNVLHNCNLAIEFNGLVSKRVNRKIGPFYIYRNALKANNFIPLCISFCRIIFSLICFFLRRSLLQHFNKDGPIC